MLSVFAINKAGKLFKLGICAFDLLYQRLFADFPLIFHDRVQFFKVFCLKVSNLIYVLWVEWVQNTLRAEKLSIQSTNVRHLIVWMLPALWSLNFTDSFLRLIERSLHNFTDLKRFSANQTVYDTLKLAVFFQITAETHVVATIFLVKFISIGVLRLSSMSRMTRQFAHFSLSI